MKDRLVSPDIYPYSFREALAQVGLTDLRTIVVSGSTKSGARQLLAYHGKTPEELQIIYKADQGMTPRTIADMQSGTIMRRIVGGVFPKHGINEEETDIKEGDNHMHYIDPLDGTGSFTREQRYSTTGAIVFENDEPFGAAICHPFEHELFVAEKNKGAYLFPLDKSLRIISEGKKLVLPDTKLLTGGVVFVDALFNAQTAPYKLKAIRLLHELGGNNINIRMTGSNIDQQRQVAAGRGELTLTDAVGGFFDIAVGAFIIEQAGGVMIDVNTGNAITPNTVVAIGGVKSVVEQVTPGLAKIYEEYNGFK